MFVRERYLDVQGDAFWYESHLGDAGYRACVELARQDARKTLARGETFALIRHPKEKWKMRPDGVLAPHRGVAWMSCHELRDDAPAPWGPVGAPDEARLSGGLYMLGVEAA